MIGIEAIRLSEEAKSRLTVLKKRTKIDQWNILCRWAFCLSLSEKTSPPKISTSADSNVEMSWRTFAGNENEQLLWALLKVRCLQDNLPLDIRTLTDQFKLHLHRGIGYLFARKQIKDIDDFLMLALDENISEKKFMHNKLLNSSAGAQK